MPDGKLAVSTRIGDIWMVENPFSTTMKDVKWSRYASGLHEVLGLAYRDGWLYCSQRGELSRLRDRDGDGRMDDLETVASGWPLSGNYHEYAFGPAIDKNGDFWITLNRPFGSEPFGPKDWPNPRGRAQPQHDQVPNLLTDTLAPTVAPLRPTRHAITIVSTIDGGHYPPLSTRGRAVRPDAYRHRRG